MCYFYLCAFIVFLLLWFLSYFFVSSRRRHTRCALVTGVQTCALPISFSKVIADAMASDSPERFVSILAKAKRRGKIFVDYLRNGRGATAVAPYSTRARPSASVSMPPDWDELSEGLGPSYFTVSNVVPRLASLQTDPWGGSRTSAAALGEQERKSTRLNT